MKKRLPRLLGIIAAAACIFGLVLVAPTLSSTLSPLPTASADVLPNGYDVQCTQSNGSQIVCTISGCPRVYEDYAGDVVHTLVNGEGQKELGKSCGSSTTQTLYTSPNIPPAAFTYSVQGCRKNFGPDTDDCGAWSDYRYTPPAAQTVKCDPAGNFEQAEVPAGQQCVPKKVNVKCPEGSPTADAVSLDLCAPVPPKACPPGSAAPEVPFGGQCTGPTNAVVLSVTQELLSANVAVTNNSALPASCAYNAIRTGGLLGPASLDRNVSVGPNSTATIDGLLWPPIGSTYRATVKCTATYDGKQVSIGESTQNVG